MICWKCLKEVAVDKVLFRTTCPLCETDLHTCKGCKFYAPGKPNDCLVPGTDHILERERYNFCEEFKVNPNPQKPPLGDKKKFDSLFKDE